MQARARLKTLDHVEYGREMEATIALSECNYFEAKELIGKDLTIELKPYHKPRSSAANALLWHCIGVIASHQLGENRMTPWEIYLMLLRKYGKYTMIAVRAEAVEDFKKSWRECEEVGRQFTGDEEWVHLLCYFGSSSYDAKEFAYLLDSTIDDMRQAGMETPTSAEMRRVLAALEKSEKGGMKDDGSSDPGVAEDGSPSVD